MATAQRAAQLGSLFGGNPEWPTLDGRIDEFTAALNAEPVQGNPEELELRHALGLRGRDG